MALRALILALLCGAGAAMAQAPSASQLDMLRNLSPEQREALMRQFGLDPSELDGLGASSEPRDSGDAADSARDRERRLRDVADEREQRLRPLRPDDVLIIEPRVPQPEPLLLPSTVPGQPGQIFLPPDPLERLSPDERRNLEDLVDRIKSRNPYRIDATGEVTLPGFSGIALSGLTIEQATKRLAADPGLVPLEIKLTLLPLDKRGLRGLQPFGYDLFDDPASTFAPVTNIPVPADYVVGPGDELQIQLYGNQNRNLRLTVGRDGRVNFPELGPIGVGGRRFNDVRADIESRVARQMIGVQAAVSLGETRSIRVFVLGEAKRPGSYTVSGLATMTSALFASGGVKPIGSLRDIQLKRQGAVVRRLDLYDLLLRGDTSGDAKLLPGDVIFIPPVGPTVALDGEVRRSAIYELRGTTQVGDLLQLAGGLTSDADPTRASLERLDEQRRRVVVDLDLTGTEARSTPLRNADAVRVARLRPTLDSGVVVQGHVFRPGIVAWRGGLRLSDVIGSIEELRPNADVNYLIIRRELAPDRRVQVLSADLTAALRNPRSESDPLLQPRDQITVFDYETGRERIMAPLLDELRRQSRADRPLEVVEVRGQVKVPGVYPLEAGMTVSDLIRAGGGLADGALAGTAEITRFRVVDGARQTELVEVSLADALAGVPGADLELAPFDFLTVQQIQEWARQGTVTLAGEVRYPGSYPIRRGESLRSVVERAGGLTDLAYPRGAVFTREELRGREQEQFDRLASRLQTDLSVFALQAAAANQSGASQALAVGQSLLAQLTEAEAVGRLVINLDRALAAEPGSDNEIALRDGDRLLVPKLIQSVSVIGEVQNSTAHLYNRELARDDYIALSGGTTRQADRRQIYVVKADGSVVASSGNRWFSRGNAAPLDPGDTVVVPLDAERLPPLPLWQAVTQILYNVAIAVAAVNSF